MIIRKNKREFRERKQFRVMKTKVKPRLFYDSELSRSADSSFFFFFFFCTLGNLTKIPMPITRKTSIYVPFKVYLFYRVFQKFFTITTACLLSMGPGTPKKKKKKKIHKRTRPTHDTREFKRPSPI